MPFVSAVTFLMRNIRLTIEYDGAAYYGWQRQNGQRSIQQTIEEAIKLITKEKVSVIGSGRTDTGVHALNQIAHFKMKSDIGTENLSHALNSVLPDDIVIKKLEDVSPEFHARFDVKRKRYIYQIWNGQTATALHRHFCWHIRQELDVEKMVEAAQLLVGTHDFGAFCGTGSKVKDYVRTLYTFQIEKDQEGKILMIISADGFLRHMVRNIVGTLVDVGKGKTTPEEFRIILDSRDRRRAGMTAPAHGLFLAEVHY
ncbi:MAG: tRNA pseudouridine(38-40) synthase TruA [Syntrophaceae bacterium]|nr:tRNA pseudouridine(38-40) synthase TruA [Syntrophaceae bacterium]